MNTGYTHRWYRSINKRVTDSIPGGVYAQRMAHLIREKKKLINRVRRIRGQLDAVERALAEEEECAKILLTIAACRGAVDGLMSEVFDGHIRMHMADPDRNPKSERSRAARELIDAARAYLR